MFLSRWIGRGRSWRQVSGSAARCRWLPCAAFGLTALWGVPAAQAVIFYSSGDAAKNTTAPAGELADSGWQYQGYWLNYTGTPVGPFHFLTAKHVGGKVGNIFTWQGVAYTATAKIAHPQADLVLWQVDQPFPFWADLHTGKDEVGKELVVFGRGRRRGAAVSVPGASVGELRGWYWGSSDGKLRWGQNVVTAVVGAEGVATQMLYATFDRDGGENEAHLATGDSGGAVFLREAGQWKLAGINLSVDGYFSTNGVTGSWVNAAIFDMGGLYRGSDGGGFLVPDQEADLPSGFYAARISSSVNWIRSVARIPDPPRLVQAVSRRAHGARGVFDVPLALAGTPSTEPRLGGPQWVVFTFDKPILRASAAVLAGTATIAAAEIVDGEVHVGLSQVADLQWLTLSLLDLQAEDGGLLASASATVGCISGDASGDRITSTLDVGLVRVLAGSYTDEECFRRDINADGIISTLDVGLVRLRAGQCLR